MLLAESGCIDDGAASRTSAPAAAAAVVDDSAKRTEWPGDVTDLRPAAASADADDDEPGSRCDDVGSRRARLESHDSTSSVDSTVTRGSESTTTSTHDHQMTYAVQSTRRPTSEVHLITARDHDL